MTHAISLREWATALRRDILALWYAIRDPRTPTAAKVVAGLVVAYALSPIDLIPDFIPILGYLDDLILVPLGILLAVKMIPPQVMMEARLKAQEKVQLQESKAAAVVVLLLWIAAAILLGIWII